MAITLKVTPEQLKTKANQLQSANNKVSNSTSRMMEIINGLTGQVWSGEAATAYTGKFKGLADDIQRLNAMCKEHVDDLNTIARNYESAEKANVSAASALQSDVIS